MPSGARFAFGPFELDPLRRRLVVADEPAAISERQLDVLILLVSRAGQIISKDDLLEAGWKDVAVGDNSIEQVISSLRRLLGTPPDGTSFIETVARRGYRFAAVVSRTATRESDAGLDALLAPHRAFLEGRAALETLEGHRIARAREVFEGAVQRDPDYASAHIGLANACVMQFEMTRADLIPNTSALALAARHAREACRLDPRSGEAWATLGFVLDRARDRLNAQAAAKRAVTLEPDNWRHQFRLAYVSWGEERLRAARRTLSLLPEFSLAHWLAATVHVARQSLNEAERELAVGLASQGPASRSTGDVRFSMVALHWLSGLIHLARDEETLALESFERELSFEDNGQLYARECAANAWYAIGVVRLRQGRPTDAQQAFQHAIQRVARHPLAHIALGGLVATGLPNPLTQNTDIGAGPSEGPLVDVAMFNAARLAVTGHHAEAAHLVDDALSASPPDSAGWLLPVEPLLHVAAHPEVWARALARLRNRAA